jgi:predicted RNA-binding protein YlxR (DUF448 family)
MTQDPVSRRKKSGRRRHVPQRTCVVCRKTLDKRALIRVVDDPDEGVIVDLTGKRNGRGAYLCHEDSCWQQALTTDVLARALRTQLTGVDITRLQAMRPQ